jgi:hypothetical protein
MLSPQIYKKIFKCYTRHMFARIQHGRFIPVLFASVALFALVAQTAHAQSTSAPVTDLDGHMMDPFHHATGKIVVLLFVRTDCPIKSETPAQIREHTKAYGYHLPILRDPDYALVKRAQVQVTPEAAVFSTDGRLLYHGRIDDWYVDFARARSSPTTHDLSAALDAAVAEKPLPTASVPAVGCFLPGLP